jgi:hypothetical protein
MGTNVMFFGFAWEFSWLILDIFSKNVKNDLVAVKLGSNDGGWWRSQMADKEKFWLFQLRYYLFIVDRRRGGLYKIFPFYRGFDSS